MPLRASSLLFVVLVVATLVSTPAAVAQNRQGDLSELWNEYPLEPEEEETRPVGAREERGSTAGPPPLPARQGGPLPIAFLILALVLAVVGLVGAARQWFGAPRERRRGGERGGGA
jgi:hypothetical protein